MTQDASSCGELDIDGVGFTHEGVRRYLLGYQQSERGRIVARLARQIQPQRTLDVGCWIAWSSDLVARMSPEGRVLGMDLTPEYMHIYNAVAEDRPPNLQFLVQDLLTLDPTSFTEKFDLVLFTEVIEHVLNPVAFLQVLNQLLRPNGFMIISTPNALSLYDIARQLMPSLVSAIRRVVEAEYKAATHQGHLYNWDIYTFYRLLHYNGFRLVSAHFASLQIPIGYKRRLNLRQLPVLRRFSRSMLLLVQKV